MLKDFGSDHNSDVRMLQDASGRAMSDAERLNGFKLVIGRPEPESEEVAGPKDVGDRGSPAANEVWIKPVGGVQPAEFFDDLLPTRGDTAQELPEQKETPSPLCRVGSQPPSVDLYRLPHMDPPEYQDELLPVSGDPLNRPSGQRGDDHATEVNPPNREPADNQPPESGSDPRTQAESGGEPPDPPDDPRTPTLADDMSAEQGKVGDRPDEARANELQTDDDRPDVGDRPKPDDEPHTEATEPPKTGESDGDEPVDAWWGPRFTDGLWDHIDDRQRDNFRARARCVFDDWRDYWRTDDEHKLAAAQEAWDRIIYAAADIVAQGITAERYRENLVDNMIEWINELHRTGQLVVPAQPEVRTAGPRLLDFIVELFGEIGTDMLLQFLAGGGLLPPTNLAAAILTAIQLLRATRAG